MIYTEILNDVDFIVSTNSATYPIADKTRSANNAMDWVTAVILSADGTWQWDDSNYTDLPIGTATLTANQPDYSFDATVLTVNEVEIKTTTGTWEKLQPIDLYTKQDDKSISDFESTAGTPKYYDKVGNSIFLYPKPAYTQAGSLKVFYQRIPSYFQTTDTTKEPGFAKHLHRYLAICIAYDWAVAKEHTKLNWLFQEKQRFEEKIKEFYSSRTKDEPRRLVPGYQNNR